MGDAHVISLENRISNDGNRPGGRCATSHILTQLAQRGDGRQIDQFVRGQQRLLAVQCPERGKGERLQRAVRDNHQSFVGKLRVYRPQQQARELDRLADVFGFVQALWADFQFGWPAQCAED